MITFYVPTYSSKYYYLIKLVIAALYSYDEQEIWILLIYKYFPLMFFFFFHRVVIT